MKKQTTKTRKAKRNGGATRSSVRRRVSREYEVKAWQSADRLYPQLRARLSTATLRDARSMVNRLMQMNEYDHWSITRITTAVLATTANNRIGDTEK